jgi:hypothetical protein
MYNKSGANVLQNPEEAGRESAQNQPGTIFSGRLPESIMFHFSTRLLTMVNKLLPAVCAIALFASCSRQTASFQRSSTESIARQTITTPVQEQLPAPAVAEAPAPAAVTPLMAEATPAPIAAEEPVLVASAAEQKTATRAEVRQAQRTARVQQILAGVQQNQTAVGTEARQLTGAEKMISKIVTKKINKQVAKGQKAQAIGGNVVIGIVLLAVALILGLIGQGLLAAIVAVIGVLFLVLGLLNSV